MHIYADQIGQITLSNNNLRISLTQNGANDTAVEAGTLIIPVNQAAPLVNSLANSLKQIDEQLKARSQETEGAAQ